MKPSERSFWMPDCLPLKKCAILGGEETEKGSNGGEMEESNRWRSGGEGIGGRGPEKQRDWLGCWCLGCQSSPNI